MAVSGSDGSIILTTKVDQSGLNKGMASMQKGVKSLLSSFKALGSTIAAVFSITAIINFSKQAGEFATQTEASVQRLIDIYGEAAQSVGDFIDANARAIGMSKASAAAFASVYGNLFGAWADQSTNAELTNRYLNMTAAVASKTGRTVQDVQERVRSGLLGNTEAIEDLGVFVNVKTIEMTDAFQRMADGRSWERLDAYTQQQVRTMAILEQATEKYGNTVADTTATTRAQYQAAYEDFQNTWGQVVNTVLIPVLKILTQVFTIATKGLQVMAGLSGKTVENSGKTSKNIKQQTKEQEKLNKAVKKGLAGFDEINTLTEQSAENAAGAGRGISGIGNLGGTLDGSSYVEEADSTLMAIMGIVSEALVAVGLILLFTGHIGWGIGFIVAGAATLAVTMASASEFGYDGIINMLTTIMGIAGGALLALGIILLWIGGVVGTPIAIGMIIAGGALIVSAVAAKAAFSPDDIKGWLSLILGIAGGALLALGIILVMVGSVPMGVGMIIAGAASLVTAAVLNWSYISDKITKFFQDNAGLIVGVSLALLVIGIILCFTGVGIPLAIGLISAGAAGLVTTVALNWNTIKEKVSSAFNAVINWVKTWGLLVLGIILTLTGNPFLGIPLIALGAKSLTEAQNPTWLAILDKLKEVWGKIKAFWNANIAPIFTAKWWADLGKKAINGLLGVIESGLNWIVDKINVFIGGLSNIVGAVGDVIGVDWNIPKIPRVSIPRLAQGAVIPPNREFLAVLGDQKHGTNIEAPIDTIKQAVAEVLSQVNVGGFNGRIEVPVMLNGREIARAVREAEQDLGTQTVFGGFAYAY